MLFAYRSQHEMDAYAATDRLMTETFACPARRCDAAELAALEPALQPGLAGGWYYHDDAQLRPDKLMQAWRQSIAAQGAVIFENCGFDRFQSRNGRATAARTPRGELAADLFVVATGAWTPLLNRELGCRVPIQPGKGYSMTMPRPAICPKIPLIFPETRVAVTPFQSGYRLGSTMEFAGYDESLRPDRLQLLKDGSKDYLQEPYCEPVLEEWFGWRPMTYDSLPIIDRSPTYRKRLHRRRPQHARPLDGHRHRQARRRARRRTGRPTSTPAPIASADFELSRWRGLDPVMRGYPLRADRAIHAR